jgi:hypothetical protein
VDDAGLASLKTLTELRKLGLVSTNVTNKGLVHLQSLGSLTSVDLAGSQVKGSRDALKALLPKAQIRR